MTATLDAAEAVGTVAAICRYPVKSMRAESMDAADLHWTWLHGDRQYAFVRTADTSDFPWLTARLVPTLVRYGACYADPDDPRSAVVVTAPDGEAYDVRDPRLAAHLAERAGVPLTLLRLGRGAFDAMPVSILATTTLAAVGQRHGTKVGAATFRPNIVIRPDDPAASEQDWLGRRLRFGSAVIGVDWLTPRCAMVAVEPETAARVPALLRTVVRDFDNRVGAYCSVHAPGRVSVGDRVAIAG